MSARHKRLPIAALERIDDLCASFEQKWQSNESPTIESLLDGDFTDVERDVLLAELVVLDIDYRRRRGDTPTKQEYLDRFPEHARGNQRRAAATTTNEPVRLCRRPSDIYPNSFPR